MPQPKQTEKPIVLTLPEFPKTENYTGETVAIPRLSVPLIRVNYKDPEAGQVSTKGDFVEYDPATKETKALGPKIVIQILHHRQSLSAYKQLSATTAESYYTPEISMKEKSALLFMAKSEADGKRVNQFLMEGDINKTGPLRTAYPDLRYQRSLYILHEGKLKNLVVYGASFSGFIDLTKLLQGQSSSANTLELSTVKKTTGSVTFYPIQFAIKDKSNMVTLEPALKQLSDWFSEYDRRIAEQRKDRADQAATDRGDAPAEVRPTTKAEEVQEKDEDREKLLAEAEELFGK